MVLDPLHDHVQGHQIVATLQNHDVRVLPGGFHVLLEHGLDRGQILVHHGLKGAAPFLHVPQAAAEDADVGIGLYEDLDVEHLPQGGILENQDPPR